MVVVVEVEEDAELTTLWNVSVNFSKDGGSDWIIISLSSGSTRGLESLCCLSSLRMACSSSVMGEDFLFFPCEGSSGSCLPPPPAAADALGRRERCWRLDASFG